MPSSLRKMSVAKATASFFPARRDRGTISEGGVRTSVGRLPDRSRHGDGPLQAGVAAACGYPGFACSVASRGVIHDRLQLPQPGENIQPGGLDAANRFILRGLLTKPWIEFIEIRELRRQLWLRAIFQTAAARADVVSAPAASRSATKTTCWMRSNSAAASCGFARSPLSRQAALGKMADATYIGLPGNPGALFTTFKIIIEQIYSALVPGSNPAATMSVPRSQTSTGGDGRAGPPISPLVQRGDAREFP